MWPTPHTQPRCAPCAGAGVIRHLAIAMDAYSICAACRGIGRLRCVWPILFANGSHIIDSTHTHHVVEAAKEVVNEDWKTALAHGQPAVQQGTRGLMTEVVFNFYGRWARVVFEDRDYSIYVDFARLNYIETLAT